METQINNNTTTTDNSNLDHNHLKNAIDKAATDCFIEMYGSDFPKVFIRLLSQLQFIHSCHSLHSEKDGDNILLLIDFFLQIDEASEDGNNKLKQTILNQKKEIESLKKIIATNNRTDVLREQLEEAKKALEVLN